MNSVLLVLARLPALLVTGVLATLGSFAVGFGVMTGCTNDYSCSTSWCGPCVETGVWIVLGWAVQGVLLLVALALCVPALVRRLPRSRVLLLCAMVPVVSVVAFAGLARAADASYCEGSDNRGTCSVD